MEFIKNSDFDDYVYKYTLLNKKDKQDILVNMLKEDLLLIEKLLSDKNIDHKLLYNREISDLNKENYTEEDFLEAVFVYISSFRELFASYIEILEGGK